MKFSFWALIITGCFFSHAVMAQDYNYLHYDLKDGLNGLTVYTETQDKDGFMWFGTDGGLTRFDGTHFRNFTTSDGLPDNEVLTLYVDSKGRLWIISFSHVICFYKDGKIHSPKNDSLLAKIQLSSEPVDIIEDKYGNIVLLENTSVHIVGHDGKVTSYRDTVGNRFQTINLGVDDHENVVFTAFEKKPQFSGWGLYELKGSSLADTFQAISDNNRFVNRLCVLFKPEAKVYRVFDQIYVITERDKQTNTVKVPDHFNGLSWLCDSLFTLNADDTVYLYNIKQHRVSDKFFLGKITNCCFKDNEGSYWFGTTGYGIFRLASNAIRNYNLLSENNPLSVYSLYKTDSYLFAGTNKSLLWRIGNDNHLFPTTVASGVGGARITGIVENDEYVIVGSPDGLSYFDKQHQQTIEASVSVKNIYRYADTILVSTNWSVFKMNIRQPRISDIMWSKRATCAYRFDGLNYVGALDGLYSVDDNKSILFLGKKDSLLSSRVSAMTNSGDTLWIATYGNGIIAYHNGKVVEHISEIDGLTSNSCRALYWDNGNLWVGTDRGLNCIKPKNGSYTITKYSSKDGLNCDIINCLLVARDTVYLGTPYGIIYFNPSEINSASISVLRVNSIRSKLNTWAPNSDNLILSPTDNSLRVDYSCISFKSQGDVHYYYRITGLDSNWKTTKENILDYASFPSGTYTLELYGINAFGVKSNVARLHITVEKPFYFETWFIVLVVALLVAVIWFGLNRRIKKIMQRESEKTTLQKEISDLEQLALRSQMNPHFIFNCLNSIQQYVFDKNVIDANRFISEFSSLIRQTLDLSSRKLITLEEEIRYLETYIKLEQARFENSFEYEILSGEGLHPDQLYLPSLLLQPFVENSIRHGIRNLKTTNGKILITFSAEAGYLVCIIEDNGVGRKISGQLKRLGSGDHDSKGMSLVQQRIDALNSGNALKIVITIEDVYPLEENTGTRITVQFPLESDIS